MLLVENLRAGYARNHKNSPPVIDGLCFSVKPGGLLAVMGPSGCGKTTLINLLAGVLHPESGAMTFEGDPLTPASVPIGLVPQNYGLLPWKTVRENCLLCARLRGTPDQAYIDWLCARLEIAELCGRYPHELSGGQAQRAALARALAARPRLILLDEPFAALDLAAAHRARELFLSLWRETGATAVVVTHRPDEALYLADHVAVMERGGRFSLCCENPWQGIGECDEQEYRGLFSRLRREILRAAGEVPEQ